MPRSLLRAGIAASAALLISAGAIAPASAATSWRAPFDRDSLNRSTPSGHGYLKGTFSWQWQNTRIGTRDERASFTGRLYLQGRRNSCAHVRVTTYVGGKLMNTGAKVEKRFPSRGFLTYCRRDGRGSAPIGGSDVQGRSTFDIGQFKGARINVCYTRNRATPPSGDCYNFTVRPGD